MKNTFMLMVFSAAVLMTGCEDDNDVNVQAGDAAAMVAGVNKQRVGSYMAGISPDDEATLANLAFYIDSNFDSQPDKAYFIYRWVRENIEPDFDRASQYYVDYWTQTPEAVLAARKAVCTGYSAIYNQLAAMSGLDSTQLYGYGVMTSYVPGSSYRSYQHAWNAVEIDGKWYLVDTSWSTDAALDGSGDPDYFFATVPDGFAYRHHPYDAGWQLLDDPVGESEFWYNLQY